MSLKGHTKLFLSHSQIEQWEQCQYRWYLSKIQKAPRAPSEILTTGVAFHAALELYGRCQIEGNPATFAILRERASVTLEEELQKTDPNKLITKSQIGIMYKRILAMITAFGDYVASHFIPEEVEVDFNVPMSSVSYTGRIDAITPTAIIDWKTASKNWEPGSEHTKDQATAYLIAKDRPRVTFVVFTSPKDAPELCTVRTHSTTRTEEQKAAYRLKVSRVAMDIRQAKETDTFKPGTGPLCGWCDVLGSCESGQKWLSSHGREPAVPVVKS
jgi:RecB family exonuclease